MIDLTALSDEDLARMIAAVETETSVISQRVRPYRAERTRRKLETLLTTKYFVERPSKTYVRYIKVLSGECDEWGVGNVRIDGVSFRTYEDGSKGAWMNKGVEELNFTYTCEIPTTKEEYEEALEKAKSFLESMK